MGKFGAERVQFILANTIRHKDSDGRISQDNKAWAKTIPMPEDSGASRHCAYLVVDGVNPGLTDLFTRQARKAMQEQQKSSVLKKLRQEPPARKPAAPKKREPEQPQAQAGCAGPILGFRCGDGCDPAENGAVWDKKPEHLSAENGCGRLCSTAGPVGAEGTGIPAALGQQQLKPADPQGA